MVSVFAVTSADQCEAAYEVAKCWYFSNPEVSTGNSSLQINCPNPPIVGKNIHPRLLKFCRTLQFLAIFVNYSYGVIY